MAVLSTIPPATGRAIDETGSAGRFRSDENGNGDAGPGRTALLSRAWSHRELAGSCRGSDERKRHGGVCWQSSRAGRKPRNGGMGDLRGGGKAHGRPAGEGAA